MDYTAEKCEARALEYIAWGTCCAEDDLDDLSRECFQIARDWRARGAKIKAAESEVTA